jgi:hypothetical protein
MTTRNEPTVGAFDISGLFGSKKVVKNPEQLLAEALQSFTDANAQLEKAQVEIARQKKEHEDEIAARQALLATADESHSRLERIKGRFAELLS